MTKNGSPDPVTLEYCLGADDYTDDNNWAEFDADGGTTPITLTNAGDKVYFRAGVEGNVSFALDLFTFRRFTLSGSTSASGNIMSLLTQNEGDWRLVQMGERCFNHIFQSCSSLTTAPELPATTLAKECYAYMFSSCTSLISAPELPAETLAESCYGFMFNNCTSLTSAPELPATTLAEYCYHAMFDGCTSLTSISVNFTEWNPSNATTNWLSGVAAEGTFTCPEGLDTTTRDASHVPAGWTVVTKAA